MNRRVSRMVIRILLLQERLLRKRLRIQRAALVRFRNFPRVVLAIRAAIRDVRKLLRLNRMALRNLDSEQMLVRILLLQDRIMRARLRTLRRTLIVARNMPAATALILSGIRFFRVLLLLNETLLRILRR